MTLEGTDLSCGYGRRAVFADVSLNPRPGELLAVLGPNGAGKTTLLKALARLVRPTAGRVTLGGRDVWSLPPGEVARVVAFAPQVLAPDWPLTVREFVALGRAPHAGWWKPLSHVDRRAVDEALSGLDLSGFRERPVTELSGGEWQRVRLAKALAQEPRVLLLDEPTAHLDPRFQAEMMTAVRGLTRTKGIAAVVTLHDLNLVGPWADRAALLAGGGLAAVGPVGDVLTADRLTAAYGVRLVVAPHPLTAVPAVGFGRTR